MPDYKLEVNSCPDLFTADTWMLAEHLLSKQDVMSAPHIYIFLYVYVCAWIQWRVPKLSVSLLISCGRSFLTVNTTDSFCLQTASCSDSVHSPFVAGLRARLLKKSTKHGWDKHVFIVTADKTGLLRQYLRELHCSTQQTAYYSSQHKKPITTSQGSNIRDLHNYATRCSLMYVKPFLTGHLKQQSPERGQINGYWTVSYNL